MWDHIRILSVNLEVNFTPYFYTGSTRKQHTDNDEQTDSSIRLFLMYYEYMLYVVTHTNSTSSRERTY